MSITFVLRSPYEPGGRYIKKFSHKSVLGWFQSVWDNGKDTEQILGVEFYGGIGHLLDARLSENLPMPNSEKELVALLHKHSYVGALKMKSGCLEIETDDDEMYLCQYVIESSFAKKYPQRTKFLLRDGWLPTPDLRFNLLGLFHGKRQSARNHWRRLYSDAGEQIFRLLLAPKVSRNG